MKISLKDKEEKIKALEDQIKKIKKGKPEKEKKLPTNIEQC